MDSKPMSKINLLMIAFIIAAMLVGCTSSLGTQKNAGTENSEGESGTLAMVDSVTVEQREDHFYAVVNGFYPDVCTYISSVEQVVEGSAINITLITNRPADVMCAAMLTPYTVDILLTIGRLMPHEYSVVVNDGPSTTFLLE